jgi:hypothetical protein
MSLPIWQYCLKVTKLTENLTDTILMELSCVSSRIFADCTSIPLSCLVIISAPIALKSHGIAKGKQVTSHPAVDKVLKEAGMYCTELL